MNRTETFHQHRPLLLSIAYRMLGSRADAEDAVQEAFLRWNRHDEPVESPKSYLATIVTRWCIDRLRSARTQREVYVGPWLPDPVQTAYAAEAAEPIELVESLTMAFLILLESLSPPERAAFLLHEVFDYDYAETARIVGKSESNCRQMVHRAKERIASRHRRFESSRQEAERTARQFLQIVETGDASALMTLLSQDIVLMSDGGGKVAAALNPIYGPDAVARFIIGVNRKALMQATHEIVELNGQPSFVTYVDHQLSWVTTLDVAGGLIQNIFVVRNPDKLDQLAAPAMR